MFLFFPGWSASLAYRSRSAFCSAPPSDTMKLNSLGLNYNLVVLGYRHLGWSSLTASADLGRRKAVLMPPTRTTLLPWTTHQSKECRAGFERFLVTSNMAFQLKFELSRACLKVPSQYPSHLSKRYLFLSRIHSAPLNLCEWFFYHGCVSYQDKSKWTSQVSAPQKMVSPFDPYISATNRHRLRNPWWCTTSLFSFCKLQWSERCLDDAKLPKVSLLKLLPFFRFRTFSKCRSFS